MEVMTQKIEFQQAKEILTEYLSESPKNRKGKKKFLVLKEIFELEDKFEIPDLTSIVLFEYGINKTTVYESIRLFIKAKILIRCPLGENEPLCLNKYELITV